MQPLYSWADHLDVFKDAARRSSTLARIRDQQVARARQILKQPLVRRVYRYEDIGRHRTWLDGRAIPLKEPMHTIFALAMSDHGTNQLLANELPLLASAARLTGDPRLARRINDQLHEMASWSPLQRPGWCAFGDRLPPDGKDGNWLATGTGVRAIADTLEIMGRNNLPAATVARLDQLLAAEIVSIVDDWRSRRPWFVVARNTVTNQWVLPTEGLVLACLVLGRERHADAYRLGTANLLAALNAHGPEGAFAEGIHYADFTMTSLMSAARAMARDGDTRAIRHPFLRNFPRWAAHHFQPGGLFINAFDAFGAARGNRTLLRQTLALAAVCLQNRDALWALDTLTGGPDPSLAGLISHVIPRPRQRPLPLFAAYKRAARVNWRSGWEDDATGVWIRGGHPRDCHDHQDRGHVNFVAHGEPVFIEAGTPAYHNPRLGVDYASGRGHNVLQVGLSEPPAKPAKNGRHTQPGWQKIHVTAPMRIRRLDRRGGDLTVDATAGYDDLHQWLRRIQWDQDTLNVEDQVCLKPDRKEIILFRWHLGTTRIPRLQLSGTTATVAWKHIHLQITSDCPLKASFEMMPDHTLQYRKWDDTRPDHLHTCLVVRTGAPAHQCRMSVQVTCRGMTP